ncbi:MAG: tetratricopeptide repeat protein [Parahaliea sp.]
MSQDNEALTPTPFEPASTRYEGSAPVNRSEPATAQPRWVIPALLVLLALAVLVLFGWPAPPATIPETTATDTATDTAVNPGRSDRPDHDSGNQSTQSTERSDTPGASPWADAQQAVQRKAAQDVLADLLALQRSLGERQVERWAKEAFSSATRTASTGDDHYKQRQFGQAHEQYERALSQLQAIEASIPERLSSLLAQAASAVETGDGDSAQTALTQAEPIAGDNTEIDTLRQRLKQLPAVSEALASAAQAEQAGDFNRAIDALQQADRLDPAHQRVSAELARVSALLLDQDFHRAMSEGYAALDDKRFDAAHTSFQRARKLRSEGGEADSALRELQTIQTAHTLNTYNSRGQREEAAENWQQAVATYKKALKLDDSVVFAQEGLARTKPRAELHRQLQDVINNAGRLSDPTVAATTDRLLNKARNIKPAGPVLQRQLTTISQLLATANQPQTVTLRSDRQTSVTLYRVSRLGQFDEHQLALRPGTYTAVGSRKGYRDVRVTFTVSPEMTPAPVTVICSESI